MTAGLMIAQQVAARASRDALFLGRYEARLLPEAMLAGAFGSLLAVVVFSKLVQRFGPQRAMPLAFAVNGGLFALEQVLSTSIQELTIWLLYIGAGSTLGGVVGGVVGGLLVGAPDADLLRFGCWLRSTSPARLGPLDSGEEPTIEYAKLELRILRGRCCSTAPA